jgi:hypothetical protein
MYYTQQLFSTLLEPSGGAPAGNELAIASPKKILGKQ